jgi:hypothetical protein
MESRWDSERESVTRRVPRQGRWKLASYEVAGTMLEKLFVPAGRWKMVNDSVVPSGRILFDHDYQPLRSWLISGVASRQHR